MKDITHVDVNNMVIDNGAPRELIVSNDDFKKIYKVFGSVNRDEKGAFVLAMNTQIRPKSAEIAESVDISAKSAFKE